MLSPRSLRDGGNTSFIVVELPIEHMKKKFVVSSHTTVGDVLALVQKKIAQLRLPITSADEYGLLNPVSHGTLHPATLISDTCTNHFLFRRVVHKVRIVYEEEDVVRSLSMQPKALVGDVERDILLMPWGKRFRGLSYSLFLISANTTAAKRRALGLDRSRTLASYRIKPTDFLFFGERPGQTRSGILRGASEEEQVMLAFMDQETTIQKTMLTSQSDEVRYVMEKLLAKVDPTGERQKEDYGLFVFNEGVWGRMDPDWQIGRYELPHMCKIRCRKLVKVPMKVFGSDPGLLPMVIDNGLEVPEVLVQIRDRMEELGAFEAEGIFRVAGVETEMIRLKQCFNSGQPVVTQNCHSMGTMLKRWYKELPTSVFQSVPEEAGEDPEASLNLTIYMSTTYKNIFLWLLDVLAHTARYEEKNKMGAKNLAIVWGPGLAVVGENPFTSLQTTRWAIEVIERNIRHRMENPRVQPPRPARADVKPPMPSTAQLLKKKLPKPPGKDGEKTRQPFEEAVEDLPPHDEEDFSSSEHASAAEEEDTIEHSGDKEEVDSISLELEDDVDEERDLELSFSAAEPEPTQAAPEPPVVELSAGIQHLLQFAPPPDHPAPPPPKWRAKAGLSPRGDKEAAEEHQVGHEKERSSDALLSPRYKHKAPDVPQRKKSTPGPGRPPRSPPTWQRPAARPLIVGSQRKVSSSS